MREVNQTGDGLEGTEYEIKFAWWKLNYTTRTEVTNVSEPSEINWSVKKDINANGSWVIEESDREPPEGKEHVTNVSLIIEYDARSVDSDTIDLPRLVSLDWVIKKVTPKVAEEGERVVERIVADLEGDARDVELDVTYKNSES